MPDAPVDVMNDPLVTSANQIGLTWSDGSFNGGNPVTDYQITYESGNGVYSILQSGITTKSYTFSPVVTGVTYSFRVQAHNSEGYSAYSAVIKVLAAKVPEAPGAPVTTVVNENLIVNWVEPESNGSPINAYTIMIRDHYGVF